MKFLEKIINNLNKLDWSVFGKAHKQVEIVLEEVKKEKAEFSRDLITFKNSQYDDLIELSKERTTHFKWFLYKDNIKGFRIWLHQYKIKSERREGYAEVPHNHLYWFSSLILIGGFNHCLYKVEKKSSEDSAIESINLIEEIGFNEGEIYSVHQETVHSLEKILEPTVTLIIQGPDTKNYSESFDIKRKIMHKHFTLESKLEEFNQCLRKIQTNN